MASSQTGGVFHVTVAAFSNTSQALFIHKHGYLYLNMANNAMVWIVWLYILVTIIGIYCMLGKWRQCYSLERSPTYPTISVRPLECTSLSVHALFYQITSISVSTTTAAIFAVVVIFAWPDNFVTTSLQRCYNVVFVCFRLVQWDHSLLSHDMAFHRNRYHTHTHLH